MTEVVYTKGKIPIEEVSEKADALINQHSEIIDLTWRDFGFEERPEDISLLYLDDSHINGFAPKKIKPHAIKIGLGHTLWGLAMPHETGHYLHFLRNPELNARSPIVAKGFVQCPTDVYHIGELVAEYVSLLYFDKKDKLNLYRRFTSSHSHSAYKPVNALYDSNKNLLSKLSSMNEEEANRDFKEVLNEMRKAQASF